MRLTEEFVVAGDVEQVWHFFEQPEAVAACMPGVEDVQVLDEDHLQVLATQSIGPMTATFQADVVVLERVPNDLIRFRATGRSVRGAVGSLRAENAVRLVPSPDGTTVVVEGEIALAGALGSVGQKVVARQARKVTAQFAGNLQRALNGEPETRAEEATPGPAGMDRHRAPAQPRLTTATSRPRQSGDAASLRWMKAATVLNALSLVVGLANLWRNRRAVR